MKKKMQVAKEVMETQTWRNQSYWFKEWQMSL